MRKEIKVKDLNELLKKSDVLDIEIKKNREKMKEELEINKVKIEEEYKEKEKPIFEDLKLLHGEIDACLNKYIKCATFGAYELGSVLEKMMTAFEGEEYCYQEADYYIEKIGDLGVVKVKKKVRLVVKQNKKRFDYKQGWSNCGQIVDLVNDGYMIVLEESKNDLNYNMALYEKDYNKIYDKVNYGKFDYVKEFIQIIIDYRYKNNLVNIDYNDMEKLLCEYALSKKEITESNYLSRKDEELKRHQEELKEYQEKIEDEKKSFGKRFKSLLHYDG